MLGAFGGYVNPMRRRRPRVGLSDPSDAARAFGPGHPSDFSRQGFIDRERALMPGPNAQREIAMGQQRQMPFTDRAAFPGQGHAYGIFGRPQEGAFGPASRGPQVGAGVNRPVPPPPMNAPPLPVGNVPPRGGIPPRGLIDVMRRRRLGPRRSGDRFGALGY